jgi:hypothetical protein
MKPTFKLIALLLFSISLFACTKTPPTNPSSVVIDAGALLTCTLLPSPKTIGSLTAQYSCAAPGAFLESVDTQKMTAQYFTADSQVTIVTFGPKTYPITQIN